MLKRLSGFGGRRSARFEMDLNPFRLCSGLKFLGYFMVVLVLGLIAVSYCAVVVLTLGPHLLHGVFNSFLPFILLVLFHVLVLFSLTRNFFIFLLCISIRLFQSSLLPAAQFNLSVLEYCFQDDPELVATLGFGTRHGSIFILYSKMVLLRSIRYISM